MGVLKGRNNSGGWSNASVVYGWNSSGVKTYAKALFMRKSDGTWERGWTDCRKFDEAGGRDWSAPSTVTTNSGTCGNRTETTTVTRTKDGCPSDVRSTTVSSPNCTSACYSAATVTEEYYDGSCGNRRLRTKTVTNPVAGSNCPSTTTYSAPYASPDCNSGCFTASAVNCDGCGSATYYTANAGSGCTSYQVGSCGTWTTVYGLWETVITLNSGSFPYAYFSLYFGEWLYTDSTGTVFVSCPGGGLYGPGSVEQCSSGGYRAAGADKCVL